jgi:hypothetical protein
LSTKINTRTSGSIGYRIPEETGYRKRLFKRFFKKSVAIATDLPSITFARHNLLAFKTDL